MKPRAVWVFGALLAVVAFAGIRWETARDPVYAFDGYNYAIRAQLDAGIPYAAARANARAAYRGQPALRSPVARRWYAAAYPEYWRLFAPRAIYPWLASRLWPFAGMQSLFWISNLAYAASVVALYALLLRFGAPGAAALVTAATALLPEYRWIGRSDLTDATAFAFWCATLLGLVRFVETGRGRWLAAYACAALAMTFSRPLAYAPFCSGVAVALAGTVARRWPQVRRGATVAAAAALCALAVVAAGAAAGAPGIGEILVRLHAESPMRSMPLPQWYAGQVGRSSAVFGVWLLASLAAPIGLIALAYDASRARSAALLGALASTIVTLAVNPLPSDVARVALLPILPAIAAGLTLAIAWPLSRSGAAAIRLEQVATRHDAGEAVVVAIDYRKQRRLRIGHERGRAFERIDRTKPL